MQINHVSEPDKKARAELKKDAFLQQLKGKTPAEISTWVDNNLNNVNDMRKFAKLTLLVIQSLELAE